MAHYPGDIPADPIIVEPANPETLYTGTEIVLYNPSGGVVTPAGFVGVIGGDDIEIRWPAVSVLTTPGVYTLSVTLTGPTGRERLAPVSIIVQADDGWHTLDSARAQWLDAPVDDLELYELLTVARMQCAAFAPAYPGSLTPGYLSGFGY